MGEHSVQQSFYPLKLDFSLELSDNSDFETSDDEETTSSSLEGPEVSYNDNIKSTVDYNQNNKKVFFLCLD